MLNGITDWFACSTARVFLRFCDSGIATSYSDNMC